MRSGACFTSDCFGAPMPDESLVYSSDIRDIPFDDLREMQRLWSTVDSPWVTAVDPTTFRESLTQLAATAPAVILSSHLPPARDSLGRLSDTLFGVVGAEPYVGPDQRALEELLAGFEPVPAPAS
jgi:hypothetical protein